MNQWFSFIAHSWSVKLDLIIAILVLPTSKTFFVQYKKALREKAFLFLLWEWPAPLSYCFKYQNIKGYIYVFTSYFILNRFKGWLEIKFFLIFLELLIELVYLFRLFCSWYEPAGKGFSIPTFLVISKAWEEDFGIYGYWCQHDSFSSPHQNFFGGEDFLCATEEYK